MKIAIFSYNLPIVGEKRGGIERVTQTLSENLTQRGHIVEVWTHDAKPDGAEYEVRALPWKRFASTWVGRRLTMGYLGNVLALLPKYDDADVLIAIGDSLLLPLRGKPIVRVMAGSALGEALHADSPWRFFLQAGVYIQELITALTQPGCVGISHNTRRYNPFVRRVIPLGINLKLFYPAPRDKTDEPSILFVGTLDGRKRGLKLIEWFSREVRPRFPDARLMMVSPKGPPIKGVTYHVGISDDELSEMYRRAWVYASPSTYEGFGLPYLEAMASGTPVVATPNSGSREILNEGRAGRLVSDKEFGATVAELLADGEQRERLIQLGLARAKKYSLSAMVDDYEVLLAKMTRQSMVPRKAFD